MTEREMRLAVASKDGRSISEHFGHARKFAIYAADASGCRLLEHREVDHYCHGQHGSAPAMERILHTIADCDAVFVARIGDGPADKLAAIGVRAVADYAYEAIDESLLDFVRREPA